MDDLFVVIRRYGSSYAPCRPLEEQLDWEAHRAFMNALEADGFVRLGGPLEGREDVLLIFRARARRKSNDASPTIPGRDPASCRRPESRAGICVSAALLSSAPPRHDLTGGQGDDETGSV